MIKRTHKVDGVNTRKNHMGWYSATHSQLNHDEETEDLGRWNWRNQKLWDWESGGITKHAPLLLFDDLERFEFT